MTSDLPAGWRTRRLADCGEWLSGGTPAKSRPEYWDGEIPWIGPKDLHVRYVDDAEEHLTPEGAENGTKLVPSNSILIVVRSMALAKRLQIGFTRRTVAFNQDIKAIKPSKGVNPRFLFHALWGAHNAIHALVDEASHGTKRLRTEVLGDFEIPIPPRSEQKRIETVLNALDDKIESNRRVAELCNEIGATIFRARFLDFAGVEQFEETELGPVPTGWRLGRLSDLCTTQYGYTASASNEAVGPKLLRVTDINKRPWIEWDHVPYCQIAPRDYEKYRLYRGDIVVARMADPGKAAIVDDEMEDAVFASYLVRLKAPTLIEAYFLYFFLQSAAYDDYIESAVSGSVQKNMNARVITNARLPIPTRDKMESFAKIAVPLRMRAAAALRESARLATVRDTLVPKLVSGEIRVADSDDPAETLGAVIEEHAA